MSQQRENILILGGNSSIASEVIEIITRHSSQITCTFRKNVPQDSPNFIEWKYLNLEKLESIEHFLAEIEKERYDRILSFMGAVIITPIHVISHSEILNYHLSHTVNYLYLLTKLTRMMKKGGNMIVLSSRAATNPSYSVHYSASKSGLEGYVRSMAAFMDEESSIIAARCGLIEGSRMSIDMEKEIRRSHRDRAGGKLLTKRAFAEILCSLTPDSTRVLNGQIIPIGPQY